MNETESNSLAMNEGLSKIEMLKNYSVSKIADEVLSLARMQALNNNGNWHTQYYLYVISYDKPFVQVTGTGHIRVVWDGVFQESLPKEVEEKSAHLPNHIDILAEEE